MANLLLKRARETPFLTPDRERALAKRAASGDAAAAQQLVVSHLRMVISIARGYGRLGFPLNDLIQEGTVGLLQAVRKFNPDHDARLATYAMWWVRAAIQDYVVRSWSLVRVGKTAAHKSLFFVLRREAGARAVGHPEHIGDDVLAALAHRFNVSVAEVTGLARRIAGSDHSLDAAVPSGHDADHVGSSLADRMVDPSQSPEDIAADNSVARFWSTLIDGALAMLPAREAAIIRDRYLSDAARTFEAIGRDLGLSKDRVRQLEKRALERLRDLLQPLFSTHGLPG